MKTLLCALLLAVHAAAAVAAPPLPAAQQRRLDRAVLDYESGRRAQARSAFEALARAGVPAARYNLAAMHFRGEIEPADPARARRLLEQAAAGGFVTAQFMLAQALDDGRFGGGRDIVQANRWYATAAANGSVDAMVAIATAYYLGRGAPRDAALAARWYRGAAEGGDVGAQYLLAAMVEHGDGVPVDLEQARDWYARAADNGDVAAPGKVREIEARLRARP